MLIPGYFIFILTTILLFIGGALGELRTTFVILIAAGFLVGFAMSLFRLYDYLFKTVLNTKWELTKKAEFNEGYQAYLNGIPFDIQQSLRFNNGWSRARNESLNPEQLHYPIYTERVSLGLLLIAVISWWRSLSKAQAKFVWALSAALPVIALTMIYLTPSKLLLSVGIPSYIAVSVLLSLISQLAIAYVYFLAKDIEYFE